MTTVCGNCGNTQGPFDKFFIGERRTGFNVVTCRIPVRGPDGKRLPDIKRRELAVACSERAAARRKANATAS